MRRPLALVTALLAVVALAACGGDDGGDAADATTTTAEVAADDGATTTTGDDGDSGGGDVDCADLEAAMRQLAVPVQLMAQVRTIAQLEAVKEGSVGSFEVDDVREAIVALRVLEAYDSVLGDPKEALDVYEEAVDELAPLLESSAPTEDDVMGYSEAIGPVGEFLGHQAALAGALDEAGC